MYPSAIKRNELHVDIDQDKEPETIDILETDFRYPMLARWRKTQNGRTREFWAVASHVLVRGDEQSVREAVDSALRPFRERERCDQLQFRGLSVAHGFRVGPARSLPAYYDFGQDGAMLQTLAAIREATGNRVRCEPDYLYFVDAPNDKDFPLQRDVLDRIRAPQAWEIQKGSDDVVVAVIDTGIDYRHPDLRGNIFRRKDESGAKKLVGWDFHNGRRDPDDDHWHGTYCAGLVGAVGDNEIGIAGVSRRVALMPVKAFSERGVGTSTHAAEAIRYAVDEGADVILCAWGSAGRSFEVEAALRYAAERQVLVVAAAGNSEVVLDDHFPASFSRDLPNVISVGATNERDEALLSDTEAHLYAPGKGVYSTFPSLLRPYTPYHTSGGTSAAAALVAGACALLKAELKELSDQMSVSEEPITAAELRKLLIEKADSVLARPEAEAIIPDSRAAKRLNVEAVLKAISSGSFPRQPLSPTPSVAESRKQPHAHG